MKAAAGSKPFRENGNKARDRTPPRVSQRHGPVGKVLAMDGLNRLALIRACQNRSFWEPNQ